MSVRVHVPESLGDYVEQMSRAVFYAGMSWSVIDAKWPGIREAFEGFDPATVAGFTPADVDRLMEDARIVRNRRKIEGVIHNAGEAINVEREFGGFGRYLASFPDNESLVHDLHRRFKFMGESTAHFFLFAIGFDLPAQEEWARSHFGEAEAAEHRRHQHG